MNCTPTTAALSPTRTKRETELQDIKACIFDLDGVLVETSEFHFQAWTRLGNEIGLEITKEINERLKGISRRRSLEHLLYLADLEPDEQVKLEYEDKKNGWYLDFLEGITIKDTLPGVVPFLDELKADGIRLAVGSSSQNAMTILDKLEISNYFDVIVDGNSVKEAKPNPEIFLRAAQYMNFDASKCVVFEDAISGIEAAKKGNFKCIGVGSAEVLHEADLVIPSFQKFDLEKLRTNFKADYSI